MNSPWWHSLSCVCTERSQWMVAMILLKRMHGLSFIIDLNRMADDECVCTAGHLGSFNVKASDIHYGERPSSALTRSTHDRRQEEPEQHYAEQVYGRVMYKCAFKRYTKDTHK